VTVEWVDQTVATDQRITNAYRWLTTVQNELIEALNAHTGHGREVLATLASVAEAKTSLRGAGGGAENG
jgi:hypothetical protein